MAGSIPMNHIADGKSCASRCQTPSSTEGPLSTKIRNFQEFCMGCLECYLGSQEGTCQQGTHLPVISNSDGFICLRISAGPSTQRCFSWSEATNPLPAVRLALACHSTVAPGFQETYCKIKSSTSFFATVSTKRITQQKKGHTLGCFGLGV